MKIKFKDDPICPCPVGEQSFWEALRGKPLNIIRPISECTTLRIRAALPGCPSDIFWVIDPNDPILQVIKSISGCVDRDSWYVCRCVLDIGD